MQMILEKLSYVLGMSARPTCCYRLYSLLLFGVFAATGAHVIQPLVDFSVLDVVLRAALVVCYIIEHILTYILVNRYDTKNN
jgi:hypothetical protein